jgi:hypothetical protein
MMFEVLLGGQYSISPPSPSTNYVFNYNPINKKLIITEATAP